MTQTRSIRSPLQQNPRDRIVLLERRGVEVIEYVHLSDTVIGPHSRLQALCLRP